MYVKERYVSKVLGKAQKDIETAVCTIKLCKVMLENMPAVEQALSRLENGNDIEEVLGEAYTAKASAEAVIRAIEELTGKVPGSDKEEQAGAANKPLPLFDNKQENPTGPALDANEQRKLDKENRIKIGLSQKDVAGIIGKSNSDITHWETGRIKNRPPGYTKWDEYMGALDAKSCTKAQEKAARLKAGEADKLARTRAGLSRNDVSKITGIRRDHIVSWETGKAEARPGGYSKFDDYIKTEEYARRVSSFNPDTVEGQCRVDRENRVRAGLGIKRVGEIIGRSIAWVSLWENGKVRCRPAVYAKWDRYMESDEYKKLVEGVKAAGCVSREQDKANREALGLTQKDVCNITGLSRNTVQKWDCGATLTRPVGYAKFDEYIRKTRGSDIEIIIDKMGLHQNNKGITASELSKKVGIHRERVSAYLSFAERSGLVKRVPGGAGNPWLWLVAQKQEA